MRLLHAFWRSFSRPGLFLGLLFLCASLTPSLLPRVPLTQGALGGVALAVGYGLGNALHWIWRFLEFKDPQGRTRTIIIRVLAAAAGALTLVTFQRHTVWQNSIRERMDMMAAETSYPWLVAGVAVLCAIVLVLLARALIVLAKATSAPISRLLPRRVALVVGSIIALLVVVGLVNGFLVQRALRATDQLFATLDQAVEDGLNAPEHEFASGGPASVIDWNDIGTNGKRFLTRGPGSTDIATFAGQDALEPVRVYAGFRSGETFEQRAALALQDLINLGGFERSVLIVATPTGTGWLDPAAVEPIAFMHGGDLAIVATQYTYVPSWLSILIEPDRSRRAARALFDQVYNHWISLPENDRPELYLFGLSLGALGSEASADLVSIFTDPIDGAFWAGPPFASTVWSAVTDGRQEGSPAWRPVFRDSSLVRFMNQDGLASAPETHWGPMRLVYLQYASDPMVFFSTDLALRRPDWLGESRGPDVSPFFDWYPFVSFLQVGFDVPMATTPPSGFGHTYDALDYIEGWLEVTQPDGWTDADTQRLNQLFTDFEAAPL